MQDLVSEVSIFPAIDIDHSAIILKVCSNDNKNKGSSYWKFNKSFCDDISYYEELTGNVAVWEQRYYDIEDARIFWELLKFEIRFFTQT